VVTLAIAFPLQESHRVALVTVTELIRIWELARKANNARKSIITLIFVFIVFNLKLLFDLFNTPVRS